MLYFQGSWYRLLLVKGRANHQTLVFGEAINKASHRGLQVFVRGHEHGDDGNAFGDEPMKNQAGVFRRDDVRIGRHNGCNCTQDQGEQRRYLGLVAEILLFLIWVADRAAL